LSGIKANRCKAQMNDGLFHPRSRHYGWLNEPVLIMFSITDEFEWETCPRLGRSDDGMMRASAPRRVDQAFGLLGFYAVGALAFAADTAVPGTERAALVVNHHEVSREEFRWFMEQERPRVIQHFGTKYQLEYGSNFWTRALDGSTPRAALKQDTVARVVKEKVEQALFQELGLVKDIRYSAFLDDLEQFNRRREQDVRDGRVVYGPVRYSPLQYYGHWKASMQLQAKELLAARRLDVTQGKLKAFYDQNRELFKTARTWTLVIVSLRRNPTSTTEKSLEEFESAAQEIARRMKSGEDAEQTAAEVAAKQDMTMTRRRLEKLTEDRMSELFPEEALLKPALALVPGEWMVTPASASGVQVVRCVARDPGGDAPYDQVEQVVRFKYLDREYNRLLEKAAATAKPQVNDAVIDDLLP
jgi:hypothetical protein